MNNTEKDILAKFLNDMINAAICYGGDPGGPYYTDGKELFDLMEQFRIWKLGHDFMIGFVGDTPMFVRPMNRNTVPDNSEQIGENAV